VGNLSPQDAAAPHDTSLAALKTVVDRGVDHIDAAFHRGDGRRSIAFIRFCVRLPKIRADSREESTSLCVSRKWPSAARRANFCA